MDTQKKIIRRGLPVFLMVLLLMAGTARAVTYNLTADVTTLTMPDGTPVPAWGFSVNGGPVQVPGEPLVVPVGDTNLTINLTNNLPEPVSLHILGQVLTNNAGPVFTDGLTGAALPDPERPAGNYTARVRSFTHETPSGGMDTYIWGAFKPGTFMLQSATNPAKQVQMGLYAAVYQDTAVGEAYPGVTYDEQLIIVYHEIDPAIQQAVSEDRYGANAAGPLPHITSSAFREPTYYLMNGMGHPNVGLDPINGATPLAAGQSVLIRFVNAGLVTHVPQLLNLGMTVVAEDGIAYTYPRDMVSFELSAAKTMDAIIVPSAEGKYALYDAVLNLTNAGASPGGMLAYVQVVEPSADPIPDIKANGSDDPITLAFGSNLTVTVALDAAGSAGVNADWWVLVDTYDYVTHRWYHYRSNAWLFGIDVSLQRPLADLSPFVVLNYNFLFRGTHIFYFGVDTNMNGVLDMGELYYDQVTVVIE